MFSSLGLVVVGGNNRTHFICRVVAFQGKTRIRRSYLHHTQFSLAFLSPIPVVTTPRHSRSSSRSVSFQIVRLQNHSVLFYPQYSLSWLCWRFVARNSFCKSLSSPLLPFERIERQRGAHPNGLRIIVVDARLSMSVFGLKQNQRYSEEQGGVEQYRAL